MMFFMNYQLTVLSFRYSWKLLLQPWYMGQYIFSSPEPKAQGELLPSVFVRRP